MAAPMASLISLPTTLLPGASARHSSSRSSAATNALPHTGRWLLGVDGGATKTVAVVLDNQSRTCAWGRSGPSNPYTVGFEAAGRSIDDAIAGALAAASVSAEALAASVAGIASADGAAECGRLMSSAPMLGRTQRSELVNDVVIAWASGTLGQPGVAMISGTGSNCFGVDHLGATWRCGGWGHVLSDEGSGYAIGRGALRAVVQARDGRGPETALTSLVMAHFGVATVEAVGMSINADAAKDRIAAVAPLVVAAASDGDTVAARILASAGTVLGQLAVVTARHLDLVGAFPVATVGSTFQSGHWMLDPLRDTVTAAYPAARIVAPRLPPVGGALWLAARLAGVEHTLAEDWLAAALRSP